MRPKPSTINLNPQTRRWRPTPHTSELAATPHTPEAGQDTTKPWSRQTSEWVTTPHTPSLEVHLALEVEVATSPPLSNPIEIYFRLSSVRLIELSTLEILSVPGDVPQTFDPYTAHPKPRS